MSDLENLSSDWNCKESLPQYLADFSAHQLARMDGMSGVLLSEQSLQTVKSPARAAHSIGQVSTKLTAMSDIAASSRRLTVAEINVYKL